MRDVFDNAKRDAAKNEAQAQCKQEPYIQDPWKRVEELESLLKRLEYVYQVGIGKQIDPLAVQNAALNRTNEQLEKENALLRWKFNRMREVIE